LDAGLNNEHVLAADIDTEVDKGFSVGELAFLDLVHLDAKVFTDFLSQIWIGAARQNDKVIFSCFEGRIFLSHSTLVESDTAKTSRQKKN
jgi:hypothetical protein